MRNETEHHYRLILQAPKGQSGDTLATLQTNLLTDEMDHYLIKHIHTTTIPHYETHNLSSSKTIKKMELNTEYIATIIKLSGTGRETDT